MQKNTFIESFSGLKNHHGHTSVDHFLQGIQDASKQRIHQMKNYQGPNQCDMCAGDGLVIEVVKQYDRLFQPICTYNKFSKCLKCFGTGRDIEAIRKAKRAAA